MNASTPNLQQHYAQVRRATERLCAPLSAEDAALQSMPDASPAKWHLAHTSWFFETFVLARELAGYRPFHPDYAVLFNSYYHSVGAQHPRPKRGLISRPSLDEVLAYRAHVDRHLLELLESGKLSDAARLVVEVGLHHEQQHQELLLTDVKHLFSCNPQQPAYLASARRREAEASPLTWHATPGGHYTIGASADGFAFDNERPAHGVWLEDFELASRPVTNQEFQAFMADGGYRRHELWLADGWDAVGREGWRAPAYWQERDGEWSLLTLAGAKPVDPHEPVCHLSFYEADAYARWADARLPSEAEWEVAAAPAELDGNLVENGWLHPTSPLSPGEGPRQLFGDVWEWTRSAYSPYPGFQPLSGALGEYNGKFMSSQMVLRGGSCATPKSHIRASYRNFFYPASRWQFSGVRLARDLR